jgi:predicted nucleic acid-binding protein
MGELTLPPTGSVYFDASPIIFSVEKIEPYASILTPVWRSAQIGDLSLIGSELLLLETLVKPIQKKDAALEASSRSLLQRSREFRLLPINTNVLEMAARLRATLNLKTPDAIHAATALIAGCVLFITHDPVFRRVPELNVSVLSDVIA